MTADQKLTKSQIDMLEIVAQFPDGIIKRDLLDICAKKKTVQDVKFEYSIKQFDLRKTKNRKA